MVSKSPVPAVTAIPFASGAINAKHAPGVNATPSPAAINATRPLDAGRVTCTLFVLVAAALMMIAFILVNVKVVPCESVKPPARSKSSVADAASVRVSAKASLA